MYSIGKVSTLDLLSKNKSKKNINLEMISLLLTTTLWFVIKLNVKYTYSDYKQET